MQSKFKLRLAPWFTDDLVKFLNNFFKWYPLIYRKPITLLEFGGGNSTLYFIQKGVHVITIENDAEYIKTISLTASQLGYHADIIDSNDIDSELVLKNNLSIIKAAQYSDVGDIFNLIDFDIVVNDGISRMHVAEKLATLNVKPIVILDNVEYCANWGRLDRTSAKPDLIQVYRNMLRNAEWRSYIFEQQEGRQGYSSPDISGWEAPHRWASAVLWPQDHLLTKLMITNIGFPIVNMEGKTDEDLLSLSDRCPFNWEKMKWEKDQFPDDLDLGLDRSYDL